MIGFNEWAARHCTIFGLLDVRQMQMVASWEAVFDACGFTADGLHAATTWLAANAPPRFPSEHLAALQGRVRDARAGAESEKEMRARRDEYDRLAREAEEPGAGLAGLSELARRRREGGA